MRYFFLLFVLLLPACGAMDKNMLNAIAFGEIRELNELNPDVDKQLILRLYRSPIYKEGCFKETHGVCQYTYFISVSTYDEYPEVNLYELGFKGEVADIVWLPEEAIDTARLKITATNYTNDALKNNQDLVSRNNTYIVVINPASLVETKE